MAKVIKLYQFSKNEFFNRYCFFLNIIAISDILYFSRTFRIFPANNEKNI